MKAPSASSGTMTTATAPAETIATAPKITDRGSMPAIMLSGESWRGAVSGGSQPGGGGVPGGGPGGGGYSLTPRRHPVRR